MQFDEVVPQRLNGAETFTAAGEATDLGLIDYWRWSASNLVSNARRGVLAEYIMGHAVGAVNGVREEWAPWDLTTPEGIRIEVKSAAFIQSWKQKRPSRITFSIKASMSPGQDGEQERVRPSHVYVFALLAHEEQATLNPMNLDQWDFYVVSTPELNEHHAIQSSITLKSLQKLAYRCSWSALLEKVTRAATIQ